MRSCYPSIFFITKSTVLRHPPLFHFGRSWFLSLSVRGETIYLTSAPCPPASFPAVVFSCRMKFWQRVALSPPDHPGDLHPDPPPPPLPRCCYCHWGGLWLGGATPHAAIPSPPPSQPRSSASCGVVSCSPPRGTPSCLAKRLFLRSEPSQPRSYCASSGVVFCFLLRGTPSYLATHLRRRWHLLREAEFWRSGHFHWSHEGRYFSTELQFLTSIV
mmetsp:Transcript_37749/g.64301  ORF Transcript_37749/g.64301 Transcript_37749/m.64301 type:complete len:216 (+) Transcript_37749:68-715(+)